MSMEASIQCDVVRALVPTFVDDEVTESVGSTVRRHLMDCPACRASVQEEQTLRQWFVPGPEVEVPDGFAARVARRAFAGDVGLLPVTPPPARTASDGRSGGRVLAFTRTLVAVAAGGLVAVTLVLAGAQRPEVADLDAGKDLDQALMELEEENRQLELAGDGPGSAPEVDPEASPAADR